uniref:Uncharacterized protein n=1 Tax=Strigamia maritima TaxID=126957 RepID=T1IRF5_STRMM
MEGGHSSLCCFGFNIMEGTTFLTVGSSHGYKLCSLDSTNNLKFIYDNKTDEPLNPVELVFSKCGIATFGTSWPRRLYINHSGERKEIEYPDDIKSIKLNGWRLVTCLEESLRIYGIRGDKMKKIYQISNTPRNSRGLIALANSQENCFLAYPGNHLDVGSVQIFDVANMQAGISIPAHKSVLAALAFDRSGSKLATASVKGTIIRVFDTLKGNKIAEFRRGSSPAIIYSLSFSFDSAFLSVSSNTPTIHIFKLETKPEPEPIVESQRWSWDWGWKTIKNAVTTTAIGCIPQIIADAYNPERNFAFVYLCSPGIKISSFVLVNEDLYLFVASENGFLYIYSFDKISKGFCSLITQHRFVEQLDNSSCDIFLSESTVFVSDLNLLHFSNHGDIKVTIDDDEELSSSFEFVNLD